MTSSKTGRDDADSPHSSVPVYVMVRRHILELIATGAELGARIPSERMLADTLGASRMTVRKAVEQLVLDGVLERDGNTGTRIAQRVVRPIGTDRLRGLSQIIDRGGATPGSRLLAFGSAKSDRKIASRLGLTRGAPVLSIRRLRSADRRPFCIETTYLDPIRVPGLTEQDLAGGQSLATLMKLRYRLDGSHVERLVRVDTAAREEAELLGLEPPWTVLVQVMLVFDRLGQPIEYTISLNHPDRVVLTTAGAPSDL